MENKKICPECRTGFTPTRNDQVYCNTTCRWKAWRKREKGNKEIKGLSGTSAPEKIQEPAKKDLFSSLRNVPETKAPETKPQQIETIESTLTLLKTLQIKEPPKIDAVETNEYKEAILKKQRIDTFGKRVLSDLQTCDGKILEIKQAIELVSKSANKKPMNRLKDCDVDFEDLFGEELFNDEFDKNFRLQELRQKLQDMEFIRKEFGWEQEKANREMNAVVNRLKTIPQFEKPKQEENNISFSDILKGMKFKSETEEKKTVAEVKPIILKPIETNLSEPEETNVYEKENTFEQTDVDTNNDKLVSSRDLRKRKYNCFPFTGKWKDFFGLPSYSFHLAVHGKPGEGKSTFCVQFADYLAKHFGKVVYVSGEEGLSKTVQDKIINNGIDNPYLFFADIKSFDEIKVEIPNEYHFIFIDSLDTLRIDAVKLKQLKEFYPQSAFITISQSTKDGQMRGSQEITHDTDIAAKVENGVAVTTKNRFQARGTEFKVFDNFQIGKKKIGEPIL
jgi:hypothetical protein